MPVTGMRNAVFGKIVKFARINECFYFGNKFEHEELTYAMNLKGKYMFILKKFDEQIKKFYPVIRYRII